MRALSLMPVYLVKGDVRLPWLIRSPRAHYTGKRPLGQWPARPGRDAGVLPAATRTNTADGVTLAKERPRQKCGTSVARDADDAGAPPEETDSYELRWPGKAAAARLARTPTRRALAPLPGASVGLAQTEHLFIEGDNLEALKLLMPTHAGRIQLIYIDPPYNTGHAFIFPDRYADTLAAYRHQANGHAASERGAAAVTETNGRFHARWLSMLYPRLVLARELLRADGALCLSIGEEEVHHARLLLDEVFGERHHRNTLAVRRYDKNLSRQFMGRGLASLAVGFEYVLIYARSAAFTMNAVFRAPSPRRQVAGYWKGFWNAADRPTMRYPLLGVTPETGQW
ncbi:MAG: site-specific DNA-methyltransferase, partial [Ktedonobacterales bacterium]|nr:site-specific DNA-methyltransferase [Ktedonobacterales bacterium]